MPTRYFVAVFPDGGMKMRSTTSRAYTHAYRFTYGEGGIRFGFSTSEAQCRANAEAESSWCRRKGTLKTLDVVTCAPCTKDGAIIPEGFEKAAG